MNPNESSDIDAKTLLAIRQEGDAAQTIAERLKVKEMGPADHIRTKHEVRAFMESGDAKAAEELLKHARERRSLHQTITTKVTQQRGQRMSE
jgi:hypothetical protein